MKHMTLSEFYSLVLTIKSDSAYEKYMDLIWFHIQDLQNELDRLTKTSEDFIRQEEILDHASQNLFNVVRK